MPHSSPNPSARMVKMAQSAGRRMPRGLVSDAGEVPVRVGATGLAGAGRAAEGDGGAVPVGDTADRLGDGLVAGEVAVGHGPGAPAEAMECHCWLSLRRFWYCVSGYPARWPGRS